MTQSEDDGLVTLDGIRSYRIAGDVPPFLVSVVSDVDLWMFLSSTGGLTAGRVNEDGAIFPYETDDKLHQRHGVTGPLTLIRVGDELWEPFAPHAQSPGDRALYKSLHGNRVTFEETREDLGLRFRYAWTPAGRFGYVRTCSLEALRGGVTVELLDALLNLLPAGADLGTQQRASCLINAYTQSELDADAGLAIVAMTSLIVDRAEPAEALRANVAWTRGLPNAALSLDTAQAVSCFRKRAACGPRDLLTGRRGGLVATATVAINPGTPLVWHTAVDAGLDHVKLAALRADLVGDDLVTRVKEEIARGDERLAAIVADADGVQVGGDERATGHHFANVLFNVMRGGRFAFGHGVPREDLKSFVKTRNRDVARLHASFFAGLPDMLSVEDLLDRAAKQRNPDVLRLCYEYLPLTFSRRHGDPSRPWNRFAVRVQDEAGNQVLDYQGNWRDIFQNWEALCLSYPAFIESVIAKFVNASTVDGFNPYRVTRAGIEWESPDPHDPWANIGYWGDHQIAYLLRLLEQSRAFHPGRLEKLLDQPVFAYANVPYRLKSYEELVENRWETIDFDFDLERSINARVSTLGTDARLLANGEDEIVHVTLLEKLLVTLLSKLSNFVPGGGIWMNTQRPEWNDANNALVGSGVSVVTLCYVRRYVTFMLDLIGGMKHGESAISLEVRQWFGAVADALAAVESTHGGDEERGRLMAALGNAFGQYRAAVYADGFTGIGHLSHGELRSFLQSALRHVDQTLRASRRPCGLYDAYNLLRFDGEKVLISGLYEMLEGQVAILASGLLTATEAVELVETMFTSDLYRPDQNSFMLYPDRALPRFVERNVVPGEAVARVALLQRLIDDGERSILTRDITGTFRFNASFRNAGDLSVALDKLAKNDAYRVAALADRGAVLDAYERVFRHHGFTGRSGTMYGYEGLGCIYWHMVSKLLLAVQENYQSAVRTKQPQDVIDALADLYYRVRGGIGFHKSARAYGAFPLDPYSHTPRHAGAQQPGMTGQVKEEIITRWGELGVSVENGSLVIRPGLMRVEEFDDAGKFSFTLCGVPVTYELGADETQLSVTRSSGETETAGATASRPLTGALLDRAGAVRAMSVRLSREALRAEPASDRSARERVNEAEAVSV